MWIIELNIAGHQFTREMPDVRQRPSWFNPRHLHWPVAQQRPEHAA